MELLKQRILKEGTVLSGQIIKVDAFLNHQIDVELLDAMGQEFYQRFKHLKVDRILTIEASGIALAISAARFFKVPVVFAKKAQINISHDQVYTSQVLSYTKKSEVTISISKAYLNAQENILIIDDFLAHGQAVLGLLDIIQQAQAHCVGIGIAIEKGFQVGGKHLREQGHLVESLAIIETIDDQTIQFRD